ncbi:hypothetical protein [Polynucleobacter asymbioticus]|uniref:hypothetical protein n=1 Tax=Polynucleobacter asymbioticus TaxID=576611 RepID=UPI00117E32D8|nr:hypothetical protein [Polynucleobacter asymbioticus]
MKAGEKAGYVNKKGYQVVRINGQGYLAHRLIYLYFTGVMPQRVDHIFFPSNRIEHLREATSSANQWHRRMNRNNKSGVKGVCFNKRAQRFIANLGYQSKVIYVGCFPDLEAATYAITKARNQYHQAWADFGMGYQLPEEV